MERVLLRDNPGSRLGRPHPQEPEVRLRRRPLRLLHHGFVDLAKGLEVLSQVVVGDAWGEAAEKKLRRRARRQLWRRIHAHGRGEESSGPTLGVCGLCCFGRRLIAGQRESSL